MYMYVGGIDVACFCNFPVVFCNCSDSVVFFVFQLKIYYFFFNVIKQFAM